MHSVAAHRVVVRVPDGRHVFRAGSSLCQRASIGSCAARGAIEPREASGGGFGAYLLFDHDWAAPAAKLRSYELFAQYVMPHFTGQLEPVAASCDWVTGSGGEFVGRAANAIAKAIEDHAAERSATTTA